MGVGWIILLILAAIILLITLIMFIRAKIVLTYNGDLSVTLKILFLKFDLHPRSLSEINVKDYTKKKIEKRRLKARKKAKKKALKKAKKEEKKTAGGGKKKKKYTFSDILTLVSTVKEIVSALVGSFFGYLRVEVARLDIVVATDDAAKTAIVYGAVYQAVSYILAIFDKITTVKYEKNSYVSVRADFLREKFYADINVTFSLRVGQLIKILIKTAYRYLKNKKTVGGSPADENSESVKGK